MEKTGFSRRAEENSGILTWSVQFSLKAQSPHAFRCFSTVFDHSWFVLHDIQIMATLSSPPVWPCWRPLRLRRFLREMMKSTKLSPSAPSRPPTSGTDATVPSASAPLTQTHLADGRCRNVHSSFEVDNIFASLRVCVCCICSPGNRRPRGTVSGSQRCPTAPTTWTLCPARPPSTVAGWAATRRGPSRCGEQHAAYVGSAGWCDWSSLKSSLIMQSY